MRVQTASAGAALIAVLLIAACSIDASDSQTSSDSGAAAPTSPEESSATDASSEASSAKDASSAPNCGNATCDATKEYCQFAPPVDARGNLVTDSDGGVDWKPYGCESIPSECADASDFCTCVAIDIGAPVSGGRRKCSLNGSLHEFGFYDPSF